ncbi:hypothetical protein [Marinobacter sp. DY40_1A1]|uniref:hypothetical protein n=1 Tax=Marinobacter sp. DY40_1A1 TaxID=2583229 RepID=UPI0019031357|nr:hypothetical protein [Marinobacter sp. DY40_1A1]MBK1885601.1 hypothetical protein [Marinobacter sp. DY40_1A1]
MAYIIFFIAGGLIGSQFGPAAGIVGALIGLALAGSESGSSEGSASSDRFQQSTWLTQPDETGTTGISSLQHNDGFSNDLFIDDSSPGTSIDHQWISEPIYTNPATGLPMVEEGMFGIDVGGNLFGSNNHDAMSSAFDTSTDSLFDDTMGSGGMDNDW